MSKYSFGVKIEVVGSDLTPTDTSIGLNKGVFEWFLGDDFPYDNPYNIGRGILASDGIGSTSKSVKIERFGDIATLMV